MGRPNGLKSARLRYFNAAGAEPTGEIGEDHQPEPHLIPLILDTALGRRSAVQVFGTDYPTPDGTAIRDYVHVSYLARAVLTLQHLLDGGDTIALNVAGGRGTSVREVIDMARAVTGFKIDARDASRRPGDPSILVADATTSWRMPMPSAAPTRAHRWTRRFSAGQAGPPSARTSQRSADAWRWHQARFRDGKSCSVQMEPLQGL